MDKTCEECGKEYRAVRKDSRHCSKVCQKKCYNRKEQESRRTDKHCEHCGDLIKIKHASKYCSSQCRNRAISRRYYWNNVAKMREKRAEENSDVPKRVLTRVKSRAKKGGIPFNLDISDIVIPKTCPVLGIPIFSATGEGGNLYNSPSLDRINPRGGYVKGNIRVISNRANLLKSDATVQELTKILKDLKELNGSDSMGC